MQPLGRKQIPQSLVLSVTNMAEYRSLMFQSTGNRVLGTPPLFYEKIHLVVCLRYLPPDCKESKYVLPKVWKAWPSPLSLKLSFFATHRSRTVLMATDISTALQLSSVCLHLPVGTRKASQVTKWMSLIFQTHYPFHGTASQQVCQRTVPSRMKQSQNGQTDQR